MFVICCLAILMVIYPPNNNINEVLYTSPNNNTNNNTNTVIVLDIDDTIFSNTQSGCNNLFIDNQPISKYAFYIIQSCVKYGYKIAILTARNKLGAIMAVPIIKKLFKKCGYKYDKYFFILNHPKSAFQYGYVHNKQSGMKVIQNIFNSQKNKMILFDDRDYNIQIVDKEGYLTQRSCDSGECFCGITKKSFVNGLRKVLS